MEKLKYMRLSISLLFIVAVNLLPAHGQVITLDSVLRAIERNNPMLQEYNYKIQAMNTYAKGATSWMPPQVGAGVFMAPYRPAMAKEMNGGEAMGSAMFSIEQMIPNPARQRAKKAYMSAQATIEQAGQSSTYNQLRAQAKQLYYQWIVQEKKLKVLKENENLISLMIKLAEVRYPYNQGNLSNIYKAQARLHEIANMQLMTESQIKQNSSMLHALMNTNGSAVFKIDTTIDLSTATLVDIDTASLSQARSDIAQIDRSIQLMRLNQNLELTTRKPEFGIRYDHMRPFSDMPNQFTLMGMVTIPFAPWASKMYKANVKAMDYEIQAMQKSREAILNEAKGMLYAMRSEIITKQKQLDNYDKLIIPALRKNYQTTLVAYQENTGDLPVVIDAWEALNMAQMEYLNNLEELLTIKVTYERELEK